MNCLRSIAVYVVFISIFSLYGDHEKKIEKQQALLKQMPTDRLQKIQKIRELYKKQNRKLIGPLRDLSDGEIAYEMRKRNEINKRMQSKKKPGQYSTQEECEAVYGEGNCQRHSRYWEAEAAFSIGGMDM